MTDSLDFHFMASETGEISHISDSGRVLTGSKFLNCHLCRVGKSER